MTKAKGAFHKEKRINFICRTYIILCPKGYDKDGTNRESKPLTR